MAAAKSSSPQERRGFTVKLRLAKAHRGRRLCVNDSSNYVEMNIFVFVAFSYVYLQYYGWVPVIWGSFSDFLIGIMHGPSRNLDVCLEGQALENASARSNPWQQTWIEEKAQLPSQKCKRLYTACNGSPYVLVWLEEAALAFWVSFPRAKPWFIMELTPFPWAKPMLHFFLLESDLPEGPGSWLSVFFFLIT